MTKEEIRKNIKEVVDDTTSLSDESWEIKYGEGVTYDMILLDLIEKEKEETVKQVRYGYLGRCPVHDNALRCLKCVDTLKKDWDAE